MYYAMMRPSEVAALTREGCHLPDTGGGHLTWSLSLSHSAFPQASGLSRW